MDQQTQPRSSDSYTANLLGNIRSHLAGLQGYDVMARKPNKSDTTRTKFIEPGAGAVTPGLLRAGKSGSYTNPRSNWWHA